MAFVKRERIVKTVPRIVGNVFDWVKFDIVVMVVLTSRQPMVWDCLVRHHNVPIVGTNVPWIHRVRTRMGHDKR